MKRSKFSLSHYRLTTCDMGQLVPIGITETLPGDTIQHATTALVRCSPLATPVMHPVTVRTHHWFVPHRLVWDDWEEFITGGADGNNNSTFPTITVNPAEKTLADYLGCPVGTSAAYSALPFRAYALIWNEWYRDQDLQTALTIDTTDGADSTTNTSLQNVCWEKDYFTSARPWEQKGTAVTVPLGSTAPVTGLGIRDDNAAAVPGAGKDYIDAGGNTFGNAGSDPTWLPGTDIINVLAATTGVPNTTTNKPQVFADLSSATGQSINLLREAFALQRFQEARARYGSRYTEYLRYLGVRPSDARLQRPEYLGGGRDTIQFSEVLSSNGASGGNLAALGGHGIAGHRSNRYRRFFEEHGYIISCMSIQPKTIYTDGAPKHLIRSTKEDFWQKELQHIGQEEILNRQVYAAHATPTGTFGYQDRYDEYRRNESTVHGEFNSTLNTWHFARAFGADPSLNASFVSCVPPEDAFVSSTNNTMWIEVKHSMQARRLVAKAGTSYIL